MRIIAAIFAIIFATNVNAQGLSFFGMNILSPTSSWPNLPLGIVRLWDACDGASNGGSCGIYPQGSTCNNSGVYVNWTNIETSRGVYNWTHMDATMATMQTKGFDVLYTFGNIPGWANGNTGCFAPPTSFQDLYDFVTALVTRYKGKIKYYEIWNEPFYFWSGTVAQMVTISQNMYSIIKTIDPDVVIVSPSVGDGSIGDLVNSQYAWGEQYLAAGGGAYFDIYSIHAYPWSTAPQPPEFLFNMFVYNTQLLKANNLGSKPMWNTEYSQNGDLNNTTPNTPTYTAVSILIPASYGVSRNFWYQYPGTSNVGLIGGNDQGLNNSGIAYRAVTSWLLNSTFTSPIARQAGTNEVRNTTMAGAIAGTPGTMPTNYFLNAPDSGHGITTTINSVGTINGVTYLEWRISGTATAGASGFTQIQFETSTQIVASLGQYWTCGININLQAGSLTNLIPNIAFNEYNNVGSYLTTDGYQVIPINSLSVDQQKYWTVTTATTNASIGRVAPIFNVSYSVGQPIDATFRIALPFMDNGTIYQGDLTEGNGVTARVVWDVSGGPTAYNTPMQFTKYRGLNGQSLPIVGNQVILSASPIILETIAQNVRI